MSMTPKTCGISYKLKTLWILVIPEGTLVNNEYPDEMLQNAAFYLVNAKAIFRG